MSQLRLDRCISRDIPFAIMQPSGSRETGSIGAPTKPTFEPARDKGNFSYYDN